MNAHHTIEEDPRSPFHPGERAVQTLAGVRDEAETRGRRMLSPELNPQQRTFFRQLPFVISAHLDEDGQPWAGLITGKPGFLQPREDAPQVTLDWTLAGNPTGISLQAGGQLGLLGIELATRRRNRLNTTLFAAGDEQWRLLIDQGYGNCPKYINQRPWPREIFGKPYELEEQAGLSTDALALARRSDTFFIASSAGPGSNDETRASAWGTDISHRGGEPGFLNQSGERLVFEDYPGNNMFNTLGNLLRYPRCGILLLDFESGDIIQLAAEAELKQDGEQRSVALDITHTRHWRPETS